MYQYCCISTSEHRLVLVRPLLHSSSPAQKPSSLLSKVPFFKNLSTSAPSQAAVAADASSTDIFRPSHYTGGFMALPPQPPSLNPAAPNFTHIHLAFEDPRAYRDAFYRPERMVVAFAGVEHSEAVQLATQYFGDMVSSDKPAAAFTRSGSETSEASTDSSWSALSTSSSPAQKPSSLLSKVPFFKNLSTSAPSQAAVAADASSTDIFRPSHYTGGFMALPPQPPSLNPAAPNFTHIHLAFEGLPISSDDIYALATLQTLLGGGGSFSAGGPGKGMYSRLYTNVLNQHGWVESCVAFNHSYTDSGLFGISAACLPGRAGAMLDVMCRELRALTLEPGHASSALRSVEVQRAKNQLRSSLLMNLESRMVELEDLGRQVQVHGRKVPVGDMCRKIEALTVDDLRRVAKLVVGGMAENPGRGSGAPTVVLQEAQAHGVSTHSLTWESIQNTVYGWQLGRR
ncbi:hypothetical protein BN1723_000736 [Verticillium longisporum]|uniref:Alpha-MPP n=1 Tax=Verticillium longisporum TaxID=100787 RepID=A0A0G4N791_VERLO|nr:hypothetical protein BN1723_000736 [Verticillium longisporum]